MSTPEREPAEELGRLTRGLSAALERYATRGHRRVLGPALAPAAPPATAPAEPSRAPAAQPAASGRSVTSGATPGFLETEPVATSRATESETARLAREAPDLASLKETVGRCRACKLCESRTQTVFADGRDGGTRAARVMFVGEAPGQHEDEQGVPFVGRAGQLLTDIIQKGMGLPREEVYIANVLKCRPPGNRDPEPLEKALCTPFLDRQIELVAPEVLIPLGLHATRHLLDSQSSMGRLRGRVHRRQGVAVVPTYHPAFLLRSPSMKKDCWQDIQVAMGLLGLERPGR